MERKGNFSRFSFHEEQRIRSDKEPSLCRWLVRASQVILEMHLRARVHTLETGGNDERCIAHFPGKELGNGDVYSAISLLASKVGIFKSIGIALGYILA